MFGLAGLALGVLCILIGIFLVFFFPTVAEHQPDTMAWTAVVLGLVLLLVGAVLVFL